MPRSAQDGHFSRDLFASDPFPGFGPSRFHPDAEPPGGERVRSRSEAALRKRVSARAPKTPGVYGMLDRKGNLVYVGKAKNLRARLMSYFRTNSRDPKAGRILHHTRVLVWEHAADELAALLRELELIQRFRPRFNVIGQPGRQRYVYVCLGRGPAAELYVARDPSDKDVASYGPFVGRHMAVAAVRRLNDYFRLRDCTAAHPVRFADQRELFPAATAAGCLRHELNACLGPCAGQCTRRAYGAAVRAARAFLDGATRTPIDTLTKLMAEASAATQFEKAAAARDKLQDLEWLDRRLALLRSSRDQAAFVYMLAAAGGRAVWYVLNRGQVWAAAADPATPADRARLADLIEAIAAAPFVNSGRRCVDSVLLVEGWFRKRPGERGSLRLAADVVAELRQEMAAGIVSGP